jgi:hypothetical protein
MVEGDAIVSKISNNCEITRKDIRCLAERVLMSKECMLKACSLLSVRDQQIMLLVTQERKRSFFAMLDFELSIRALDKAFDQSMGSFEDFYRLCFAYTDTTEQKWCCIVLDTTLKLAVIYNPCNCEANEEYIPYCRLIINTFLRARSSLGDSFIEWNCILLKTYGDQNFENSEDSGIIIAVSLYMIAYDCPVYCTQAIIDTFRENLMDWFLAARLPI